MDGYIEKQAEYTEFMERWKGDVALAGAAKEVGADRVAELVEADKAGRCVVLPFDIGDSVFDIGLGGINEWEVTGFSIGDCNLDPDSNYGDPYNGELVVHTKSEELGARLEFPESSIGSYVFTDHDATEAALKKMKEAQA